MTCDIYANRVLMLADLSLQIQTSRVLHHIPPKLNTTQHIHHAHRSPPSPAQPDIGVPTPTAALCTIHLLLIIMQSFRKADPYVWQCTPPNPTLPTNLHQSLSSA